MRPVGDVSEDLWDQIAETVTNKLKTETGGHMPTTPLAAQEIEEIKEGMPRLVELTDRLDGAGGFTGLSCSERHELAQMVRPLPRLLSMLTPAPLSPDVEAVTWFVEVQDQLLLHHLRWQAIVHEGVNAAMRHPGCEKALAAGCADRRRRWQSANYELWASCDAARDAFAGELGEVE